MKNFLFFWVFAAFFLVTLPTAHAQSAAAALFGPPKPSADAAAAIPEVPKDTLGRDTPRGTLSGFLSALGEGDYAKASQFLNLESISKSQLSTIGPLRAKDLQTLMDNGAWITPASMVSNDPMGKEDDGLGEGIEKLGSLKAKDKSTDMLVEKIPQNGMAPVWLISRETVDAIPALVKNLRASWIDRILPDRLLEPKWFGVPIGHWAAMLALIAVSYIVVWGMVTLLCKFLRRVWKNKSVDQKHVIDAFQLPVMLYLSVWVFVVSCVQVGISVVARQYFSNITIVVAWFSLALLMWKLIDVIAAASQKKLIMGGKYGALSGVQFFRRMAKFLFAAILVFVTLDTVGIDVTAGLAALGIGGLALAFGAQKTIENFIGSIMVIFDQPVRIGDYCQVGNIAGTIEDIGMRSTRIRTLNRTLVTIPNGDFSAQRIENFTHRDQFRIFQQFDFRMDISAAQLRFLIVEFRSLLFAHPRIDAKTANVKFIGWADHAAVLELNAYVITRNNDDFMEVREDIFLRILDIIEKSGANLTTPATPYAQFGGPSSEIQQQNREAAEARINEMTEKSDLPMPKFDQSRIDKMKNSIEYPPKGSSSYKGKKE